MRRRVTDQQDSPGLGRDRIRATGPVGRAPQLGLLFFADAFDEIGTYRQRVTTSSWLSIGDVIEGERAIRLADLAGGRLSEEEIHRGRSLCVDERATARRLMMAGYTSDFVRRRFHENGWPRAEG